MVAQAKRESRLTKTADGVGVDLHERWRAQVTDSEHEAILTALDPTVPANGGRLPAGEALGSQVVEALRLTGRTK